MRTVCFIFLLCVFFAGPAFADPTVGNGPGYDGGQVYWGRIGSYYQGQGGEFTIYSDGGRGLLLSNSAYTAGTTGGLGGHSESFQTFCVEAGEYVAEPMNAWVSESSTVEPYVYGSGSHAWSGGVPGTGDDLDPQTAWLYTQFATGNLTGYNYGSGGYDSLSRAQTASALQRLIWSIEDEDGGLGVGEGTSFMGVTLSSTQADLIGLWNSEWASADWSGIGNVRVLQMKTLDGSLAQDQLYLVPVPAAVLLGVLGMGVAGLKLRKYV